ncbi:MAG: hypothetical protein OIN66_03355 [Candidatus Methanoperedens sp.]|nr:hypothetical protein [Candidatus Methanoperedens sp.]
MLHTRVAIAGAGIAGAYLQRLLLSEGRNEIHIYDPKHTTRCGISPCAWGATGGFNRLLEHVGLDPEKYILQHLDHVIIEGTEIKVDIVTFNKPLLISDLLSGAAINNTALNPGLYERVIDATGTERAYLPSIENDIILSCSQSRVQSDKPLGNWVNLGHIGYAWCFPLSDNMYHIGYGSISSSSFQALSEVCRAWRQDSRTVCRCEGRIRITSPHYSTPFVDNMQVSGSTVSVWGIGEAIGCVGPLAGDGIVPGMRSAQLLVEHWDDAEGYTHAILNEFKWMRNERRVVDKLYTGEKLGLGEAWVFKNNARRAGMKIGLWRALRILKRLRET